MSASNTVLSHEVTTLLTRDGLLDAQPVEFAYDPSDPYVVTLTVPGRGVVDTWTFSREMLRDGLATDTVASDVAISPDAGAVTIDLTGDEGRLHLDCARRGVDEFLDATYAAVAPGAESASMDVDRLIEALLAGTH